MPVRVASPYRQADRSLREGQPASSLGLCSCASFSQGDIHGADETVLTVHMLPASCPFQENVLHSPGAMAFPRNGLHHWWPAFPGWQAFETSRVRLKQPAEMRPGDLLVTLPGSIIHNAGQVCTCRPWPRTGFRCACRSLHSGA